MLSKQLELTLNHAFKQARVKRHEFLTVEHLLLALLNDEISQQILTVCGADLAVLETELLQFLEQTTPVLPEGVESRETLPTLGFQRVLQRAVFHVQSSGNTEVTSANVLVAIYSEQESQAVYLLKKHNDSRLDVVNYISHGFSQLDDSQARGAAAAGES